MSGFLISSAEASCAAHCQRPDTGLATLDHTYVPTSDYGHLYKEIISQTFIWMIHRNVCEQQKKKPCHVLNKQLFGIQINVSEPCFCHFWPALSRSNFHFFSLFPNHTHPSPQFQTCNHAEWSCQHCAQLHIVARLPFLDCFSVSILSVFTLEMWWIFLLIQITFLWKWIGTWQFWCFPVIQPVN